MIGTSRQLIELVHALYTRYRGRSLPRGHQQHCARRFRAPAGIPTTPYVPDLPAIRAAIGSGSSYVIANLDGAFTKYYEATAESEYRAHNLTPRRLVHLEPLLRQLRSGQLRSASLNDAAIFIGSSNIGDGAGRQLWNMKYGNLRGDRRKQT